MFDEPVNLFYSDFSHHICGNESILWMNAQAIPAENPSSPNQWCLMSACCQCIHVGLICNGLKKAKTKDFNTGQKGTADIYDHNTDPFPVNHNQAGTKLRRELFFTLQMEQNFKTFPNIELLNFSSPACDHTKKPVQLHFISRYFLLSKQFYSDWANKAQQVNTFRSTERKHYETAFMYP